MKNRIKTLLGVCMLMMIGAGCALLKTDRERNEVVFRLDETINSPGHGTFNLACIEQTTASADNGLRISDVCIEYPPFMLQVYRIEGDKVVNYHWSDHLLYGVYYLQDDDNQRAAWDECQTLINKKWAMRKAHQQLPNRLGQSETFPQPQEKGSVVTVTHMEQTERTSFRDAKGIVRWRDCWAARQWAGTPNDVPVEIEAFRQNALQSVSVPEYRRYYSSFVRATPLLTKEALEAEQDTPLLGRGQRYHVKAALQCPFLLIPVPEGRPPISVTGYKPGDKFKVQQDCNGEPCYFLIETFKGEAGKNPSRRAFKRPYNPIP